MPRSKKQPVRLTVIVVDTKYEMMGVGVDEAEARRALKRLLPMYREWYPGEECFRSIDKLEDWYGLHVFEIEANKCYVDREECDPKATVETIQKRRAGV